MPAPVPAEELEESRMPLWGHLQELRDCLVRSLMAVGVGFCLTYYFSETIVTFLEQPLLAVLPASESHLYFTGITDKFFIYLQVSAISAVVLVSPYLFYQIWVFVSPALYKNERRFVLPFVFFATLAFVAGTAFGYYVVLPYGYKFLIEFGSPQERAMITLTEYFSLTLRLLSVMGLVFEVPVFFVLLAKFGIVEASVLRKFRRHAIVANAVLAAVLTPTPDAFTMILVLVPLCLLYELGIIGAMFVTRPTRPPRG